MLTAQFDATWKTEETAILAGIKKIFTRFENSVLDLETWISTVHRCLVKYDMSAVNQIFVAPTGVDQNISLLAKGKAAVKLLLQLLGGKQASNEYTEEGVKLSLPVVPQITESAPFNNAAAQVLLDAIPTSVVQISNLQVFVSKLADRLPAVVSLFQKYLGPRKLLPQQTTDFRSSLMIPTTTRVIKMD